MPHLRFGNSRGGRAGALGSPPAPDSSEEGANGAAENEIMSSFACRASNLVGLKNTKRNPLPGVCMQNARHIASYPRPSLSVF